MDLSRRQFTKIAGLATVGTVISSNAVWAANSDTLKIGLIGCGGRGTGAAEQALNADPNVVLSAMADAFSDHLEESYNSLKQKFSEKVQVADNKKFVGLDAFQKLIDSDVDVILLATPPAFRPEHLEAAVNAGKHIFCEKPFAVDAPGLRRVMMSCQKSKRQTAYPWFPDFAGDTTSRNAKHFSRVLRWSDRRNTCSRSNLQHR